MAQLRLMIGYLIAWNRLYIPLSLSTLEAFLFLLKVIMACLGVQCCCGDVSVLLDWFFVLMFS